MSCPLRENILNYDRPVPRYTSYPTAPHFKAIQDEKSIPFWAGSVDENKPVSLYVHVPYCSQLCWYCGCHTKITKRYAPVEDYARLMMREIQILSNILPEGLGVNHIHFGGGSPGLLQASDFEMLMTTLRERFSFVEDSEIAIEIDPRGLTEGRVSTYAKNGVNRVSLGVQDFNDQVLKSVNRPQPFHLSYQGIKLLREYGITKFNMDLLYGLPHQTTETMKETIEQAITLNPDRISLFGYAHVPWMKKHMRLINEQDLPDKSLRFDLFETGSEILKNAGYIAIGIDHFARPEDNLTKALEHKKLNRNFQGYTTDTNETLIGIGASSISRFKNGYVQNAVDMPLYEKAILSGKPSWKKLCPLSKDDHIRAKVIESLMCYLHVDLAKIRQEFSLDPDYFDYDLGALSDYVAEGLVSITDNDYISIEPDARTATRLIAAVFDHYYSANQTQQKHAKAI